MKNIRIPILSFIFNAVRVANKISLTHKRKLHYFLIIIFVAGIIGLIKLNSGLNAVLIYCLCFGFMEILLIQANITESVVSAMFIAENAAHALTMSGFYLPTTRDEINLRKRTEEVVRKNLDCVRALIQICGRQFGGSTDNIENEVRAYFLYQCTDNSNLRIFAQSGFNNPVQNSFRISQSDQNLTKNVFYGGKRKIIARFDKENSKLEFPYISPDPRNYHKIRFLMLFPFTIEGNNIAKNKGMVVIECDKIVIAGILSDIIPFFHKLIHFIAVYWACSCCCPLYEAELKEVYCEK